MSGRIVKSVAAQALVPVAAFGPSAASPPPALTEQDLADAYARGVADGHAAARTEHEDAVVAVAAALGRLTADAHGTVAAAVEELRRQVVDLGLEVGRWLVEDAVERDGSVLRARLDAAMAHVAGEAELRVLVHPTLVDRVGAWAADGCTVVGDDALGPADVVIRTNAGAVVGTVDDALDRLRAAMEEPTTADLATAEVGTDA
jgi:flagellar biosynthesis/type III secretory pathway protein FliH